MSRWSAKRRVLRIWLATAGFVAALAWPAGQANGESAFWDEGGNTNRWNESNNWNPNGVPSTTSDVTLGVFIVANFVIDAEGPVVFDPVLTPHYEWTDPELKANSITIVPPSVPEPTSVSLLMLTAARLYRRQKCFTRRASA